MAGRQFAARRRPPRPQPRSPRGASSGGSKPRRATGSRRCAANSNVWKRQLSALAGERLRIEAALSDPGTYTATAAPEQQRLFRRHGELSDEIVQLEARWLE